MLKISYSEELNLLIIKAGDMQPSWTVSFSWYTLVQNILTKVESQNYECSKYIKPQEFVLVLRGENSPKNRQVIIYYLNNKTLLYWFCFSLVDSRSYFVLRVPLISLGSSCYLQIYILLPWIIEWQGYRFGIHNQLEEINYSWYSNTSIYQCNESPY